MASNSQFPSQAIPQYKKTPEWCSLHLDYAQFMWIGSNSLRDKMNKDYLSYNGVKSDVNPLAKTNGKKNKSDIISYRAHKPKMQLMVGEFFNSAISGNC